jgi:glycosyltransferase involved in cell wall biosynthesis
VSKASKRPTFSIITTCKGRLEHLKLSLPAMLAQADSEVIVVDYSCPESAADYVDAQFPKARTVRVEGEEAFSNWKARNAGAAVARGAFLVFCDADIVVAADATEQLAKLIAPLSFGYFKNVVSKEAARADSALSANQLKGFQVIPRASFNEAGGYDELLAGYAAGGDTELEDRLRILKLEPIALGTALIERVLDHDDKTRMRFHGRPAAETYLIGFIYRWLKIALMSLRKRVDLEIAAREQLHELSRQCAVAYLRQRKSSSVKLKVVDEPLSLLRMLGDKPPRFQMSINVEIAPQADAQPPRQPRLAADERRR